MKEKQEQNESMPAKGVRLRADQWESCDRLFEQLGLASRNAFLRDAVDFYIEYLQSKTSVKFLTPALESVIGAKIRDSEERLARILFKLAVGQNMLAHITGGDYQYEDDEIETLRLQCIRELKETNGTINVETIMQEK